MKTIKITVPDYNDSFTYIVIQNKSYYLRFTYIDTFDYWVFGVYDSLKEPIVTGLKMIPSFPLNLYCSNSLMPNGVFGIMADKQHVGRNDFKDGKADFVFIHNIS